MQSLIGPERKLLKIDEVPEYQRFNPYIRTGYRSATTYLQCLKSLLYLHNETMNIWSHLVGFIVFSSLLCWDFYAPPSKVSWQDLAVILCIITCYQFCMILSVVFHTFTAHSQSVSESCLTLDLCGIAASITATYISGIYYAFFCQTWWRNVYFGTVGLFCITGAALLRILPRENHFVIRVLFYVLFTAYGTLPTIHWTILSGGFGSTIVQLFLPRIVIMYGLLGLAFLFYIGKLPERFLPGKFDLLGSSHQWWHVFVFISLTYWHNTGFTFAEFRLENQCSTEIDPQLVERIRSNFWLNI